MMRIVCLMIAGLLAGLLAGCQDLNSAASQEAVGYYVKGQLLADKGDYESAIAELKKAIAADPKLSVAQCAVGDIYRKKGEFELARRSYEIAVAANPYSLRPQYNLGFVFQAMADESAAPEVVKDLLGRAVRAYLRALTIREKDFDTTVNLGACYFRLNKQELAEQYCKAATELRPDSAFAHSNLGVVYDAQGRLYPAIVEYKHSLECQGQQPAILLNLGSAYLRGGAIKDALQSFEAAAGMMPKDSAPLEQVGACHFYLADKAGTEGNVALRNAQEQKSIEAYRKAIEVNPKSAAGYCGLGAVYMAQHLRDKSNVELRTKALEAWRISLEIEPRQKDLAKQYKDYLGQAPATKPAQQGISAR